MKDERRFEFEVRLSRKVEQIATLHLKAATPGEARERALGLAVGSYLLWEFWGTVCESPRVVECSEIDVLDD